MWTVAAANKRFRGSLGNYCGLTDQHLAHYFSNPVIKAHLIKTGLVTKDGVIIPESDLKVQYIRKQKQRDYQELLANAIVQKALHLEHARQAKIREHLEDIAKIELVERIKRPHTTGTMSKSSRQPTLTESPYQYSCSSTSLKGSFATTKRAKSSDYAYRKPKTKISRKLTRRISSGKSRNSDYDVDFRSMGYNTSSFKFQEKSKEYIQSRETHQGKCQVTLHYHGNKIFWWMNKLPDQAQEIIVKQQHCGGNPVVIFKGTKTANENFTFTSHRHSGYPFSITIFIDGIRDLKLSACCEYRYKRGSRLGGKTGHFSYISVEGGNPCRQCQVMESKWISQSPVIFFPKNSHHIPVLKTYTKSVGTGAQDFTNPPCKENFAFMKEDNLSHAESEIHEETKQTIKSIQDNEDDAQEICDEVESLKTDRNESDPVSSVDDGSQESIKSGPDDVISEANEAYSEVDAGPEQCVDLEYNSDSGGDGIAASHQTASSSASDATKQPSEVENEPHHLNLDVRSLSEDEGGVEHVVIAEVHAPDTSDI